jgi:cytochrome oxidase Cu insertion factor (SCO1/SenC/PrrC family)
MRTSALILTGLLLASSVPAAETPRPSPELTLQRYGAVPFKLSQLRGKVVALAFINTTCSHCQNLTVSFKTIQRDYAARNVQLVACAIDENVVTNFPMYLRAFEPNFTAGYTTDAAAKQYLKWNETRDGVLMVPYMIFIDARGVIRGDFNGKDGFFGEADKHIRAELDKLTKPAAKPAVKKK